MTSHKPLRRLPLAAAVSVALLSSLPGCAAAPAASSTAVQPGSEAATVERNASTGIAKITLTGRAVQRLELKTDQVKPGAAVAEVLLPYAALLYDASGKTWVYTNPEERVYQRQAVTVAKVEAGVVTATAGPPAGSAIVTVGAAELFGAEFDTAH